MAKAQVVVEMSSDEAKLFRGMQKITAQQKKMEDGWKKNAKESDKAGKKAEKGFGSGAARNLKNYVTGLVGVTSAIGAVVSAMRVMEELTARAAQRARASRVGVSQLAQLANTPEEMKDLLKRTDQAYARGGFESRGEAAGLIFALSSADALKHQRLFVDLKSKGLVGDPGIMARAADTLQTTMGKGETGTMRNLVSKSFAASKFAPATAEGILQASSRSGGSASALGMTDEEVIAATALLSKSSGGAELGGTQLASFLKSIDKKGNFVGLGLSGSIDKIESMDLKGEALQKFFGRQEAVAGFRTLSKNKKLLARIISEVETGQAEDIVTKKLGFVDVDPSLTSALGAERAEARSNISLRQQGSVRNVLDAMQKEEETAILNDKYGFVPQVIPMMFQQYQYGINRMLGNDEGLLRRIHYGGDTYSQETKDLALGELKKINNNLQSNTIKHINTNEE